MTPPFHMSTTTRKAMMEKLDSGKMVGKKKTVDITEVGITKVEIVTSMRTMNQRLHLQ